MRRLGAIGRGFFSRRTLLVGPSSGFPDAPTLPEFGRRRRQKAKESQQWSLHADSEAEARTSCLEKYGFVQKPFYMASWVEFHRQLRQIELQWLMAPGSGGVYYLRVIDHFKEDRSPLCELRAAGSLCTPLADFFECCGGITQGQISKGDVRFAEGNRERILHVEAQRVLGQSGVIDKPLLPVISNFSACGTAVDVSVRDLQAGTVTSLLKGFSLQALNYAFLTSIPPFLKRTDVGVRNVDFVSNEQMKHFRFAWCFLRKESGMTPVDMGELDALLPP